MKQTFFMSLFLIAAMILSACSKPLWDGTIWNNPLPDYAYPGPVPIHGTYYSQSMNVNVGYNVLLPPEYDGSTRFPVIYVFGGLNSDENTYLVGGIEAGFNPDRSGIIIVYGNGGRDSKYYDAAPGSPMYGHEMAETTITQELIPAIDHTFRTIQSREGRAIMGGSGGGLHLKERGLKGVRLITSDACIGPPARGSCRTRGRG